MPVILPRLKAIRGKGPKPHPAITVPGRLCLVTMFGV